MSTEYCHINETENMEKWCHFLYESEKNLRNFDSGIKTDSKPKTWPSFIPQCPKPIDFQGKKRDL